MMKVGDIFSTPFEKGCIVLSDKPDPCGSFAALDSDRVRCSFHVDMVTEVTGHTNIYITEDHVYLVEGDRAYNYYDMKPGKIGRHVGDMPDPWFEFIHDDGTTSTLNGQRICSIAYAKGRGFRNA